MLTTIVIVVFLIGIFGLGLIFLPGMFMTNFFIYHSNIFWWGLILGIVLIFYFVPINLWVIALFSGVKVRLIDLILMRIRRVPPSLIVD